MSHAMTDIPEDAWSEAKAIARKAVWADGRGMIGRERNYLEDRVARAILADRAAQAERMARLEEEAARLRKALDEKVPLYHPRRRRAEVRFAVSWLLYRARQMNDPHAQQILNAAAYNLGQEGEPVPARALSQEGSEPS